MYVKEITIDGFKSYAKRVTVQGLDPHFNAITGLNGSGKSNILDSICFVLGIKNLSQVRASNLQELVYKQGHAGISKATVCVTFVNNDPENGPQGYADCKEISVTRQIVIGGRDKYMINGRQSTAMRVQDLFHSVQLNVNNPHFLIMQGRITKVLNMKPPEILGLLEEAAGTKMYEKKRDVAMRTLQKKDMKLQEIDELLEKELQPSLERLRGERAEYQRYQHELSSMDRLKRFVVAWQHHEADRLSTRGHSELQQLQQELQQNEVTVATLQEQLKELEKQAEAMEEQQGGRMKERLARAQAAASDASKKLVEASTKCDNMQELLQAEQQAQDKTKERMKELDDATLLQAVQDAQAARDQAQAQLETAQQAVAGATTRLAGAEEGDCRDAQNRSVQEQLAHLQNQQTAAGAAAQQAEVKVKHLQKEVDLRRAELARKEKGGSGLQAELRKAQDAVQACQQQLQALQYDAEAELQVKQRAEASEAQARRLRTEVDELAATLGGVDFEFRDPHQGFDRSKVKGVVAKLVSVKDAAAVTALEVAAGGKLYQVVVDSDDTGKKLLQRGGLKRRCTIIPLTKIRADTLPAGKQQRARQLAGSRAQLALELVGYDPEVENAMRYVFGSAFVCQDAKTAQLLALKSDVRARSISLQGDDYNPSGTLTGGSRSLQASLLTRMHRLSELQQQLDGHQAALAQANRELQALAPVAEEHTRLTQQLEVQQHSLELLQQRMQGSERQQLAAQVAALEGQLAKARDDLQEARRAKKEAADSARSLEEMVRNFSRDKDKYVKAAKKKLEAAKAELQTCKAAAAAQEQALQMAMAERESGAASREELAAQLQGGAAALTKMEAEVASMREQVEQLQQQHQAAQSEATAVQEAMTQQREEARQLGAERIRIGDAMRELHGSRKALEHAQSKKQRRVQEAGDTCARLEKDPEAVRAAYEENAASISKLEKKVNRRVMQMCDQCEQEVQELMQKRSIVAKDKHKIEQVIGELDLKKRESLKETWKKVNQDFGSIFSTLLPGTSAKLEPPESADGDFMQGLEVRVAFGGVWKESLSELSGGQRSLLALSIILSLLLFKPAPIYILDEVDAALDLSHTQNIGRMIKRHFPYSQFIIVSLKSGMFDNANVIFRTKFVDGVSSVTRTVNRARPAEQEAADDGDEPQQGGQKTRGRQRPPLQENVRW